MDVLASSRGIFPEPLHGGQAIYTHSEIFFAQMMRRKSNLKFLIFEHDDLNYVRRDGIGGQGLLLQVRGKIIRRITLHWKIRCLSLPAAIVLIDILRSIALQRSE